MSFADLAVLGVDLEIEIVFENATGVLGQPGRAGNLAIVHVHPGDETGLVACSWHASRPAREQGVIADIPEIETTRWKMKNDKSFLSTPSISLRKR
jgi:hypothetical protein